MLLLSLSKTLRESAKEIDKMTKELNVLYQFDNNYAPYAGISMLSLFENNKHIDTINVYCAAMDDVSDENIKWLNKTAAGYHRQISYLDTMAAVKQIKEMKLGVWNGSLATWIKIFIIGGFIEKHNKLLYIDSDTLIEGSLADLCDYDFEGKAVASVVDSLGFERLQQLGIQENKYYYNAGVMFLNLEYFRQHEGYYDNMIKHLAKNVDRYPANDQDLLNDYFGKNIKQMSPQYNLQGFHYMYSDNLYFKVYGKYDYYSKEEIEAAKNDVRILHFFRAIGDYPWTEGNYHPLKAEFERWKNMSLWRNRPNEEKKRSLVFKIERKMYRYLPKAVFLHIFKFITKYVVG